MKGITKVIGGIVLGPLVGNIAALPFGLVIDSAYGHRVTGAPLSHSWPLTLPNIVFYVIMALLTGIAAAIIAGRKGWLIGALTQFLPVGVLTIIALIINRDIFSTFDVPPAFWSWTGLIPALIGGYIGGRATSRGRGFDLLWLLSIPVGFTLYFEIENIISAFHNMTVLYHRFTWLLFLSPAAACFFSASLSSVFLPIQVLIANAVLFDRNGSYYRRRYRWSAAGLLALGASCALLQLIAWGSFPLPANTEGRVYLRMVPFLPWPAQYH